MRKIFGQIATQITPASQKHLKKLAAVINVVANPLFSHADKTLL
jgi:hypothetical protein